MCEHGDRPMHRVAPIFAGLFTGMLAGWMLFALPLAAFFGPTTVTWDATGCPAGVFTVTSTARSLADGTAYFAMPTTVSLPRSTVVQEFPNLPPGEYSVTATLRGGGQTLTSEVQRVVVQSAALGGARRRPPDSEQLGTAVPRGAGQAPPQSQSADATAPASASAAAQHEYAHDSTIGATSPVFAVPRDLQRLLIQLGGIVDPMESEAGWWRVELADTDGDGSIDVAVIELSNGATVVWIKPVPRDGGVHPG